MTTGAIIIAEILLLHIHEAVAGKSPHGKTIVDIDKYEPIARLGGLFYCRVKEVFELPRPNEEQISERQQEYYEQARHTSLFCYSILFFCIGHCCPDCIIIMEKYQDYACRI